MNGAATGTTARTNGFMLQRPFSQPRPHRARLLVAWRVVAYCRVRPIVTRRASQAPWSGANARNSNDEEENRNALLW